MTRSTQPSPLLRATPSEASREPTDDRVTFESIFDEYGPYLLRVIPRMGVAAADVDDVAQEVFLAIHRSLPSFEGRSSPRTWAYGICIRVCADHRRRRARKPERPLSAEDHPHDFRGPERDAAAARALRALDQALTQLPDGQRAAFVLFEVEGLSMHEVSAAMNCPLFTAYARLYAARRRVRAALADHHVTSTGGR